MPSIKIYPPAQLPDRALSETHLCFWKEELEVYLSQEKAFKLFLPNETYDTSESAEEYSHRLRRLNANDMTNAGCDVTEQQANDENEEKLADMRTNLRTLLSIVGKCVSEGHYN